MKRILNFILPTYAGTEYESVKLNGKDMCLAHDIYIWCGLRIVGESMLYQSITDAIEEIKNL